MAMNRSTSSFTVLIYTRHAFVFLEDAICLVDPLVGIVICLPLVEE